MCFLFSLFFPSHDYVCGYFLIFLTFFFNFGWCLFFALLTLEQCARNLHSMCILQHHVPNALGVRSAVSINIILMKLQTQIPNSVLFALNGSHVGAVCFGKVCAENRITLNRTGKGTMVLCSSGLNWPSVSLKIAVKKCIVFHPAYSNVTAEEMIAVTKYSKHIVHIGFHSQSFIVHYYDDLCDWSQ